MNRQSRLLWVTRDDTSPHPYLVESARRAGATVRELRWAQAQDGQRPLGRVVAFGRRRAGREHPLTLKVVGPRLFMKFARAPEDVIVVYELGLVGLYAGLSKALRRRRRVVSLVEGDYQHLGRTGTAAFKLPVRRLAARLVDVFVANNELARDYLAGTLNVPASKIVVGWWLAGLPPNLEPSVPPGVAPVPDGTPLFVCAGRLIPPKGVDLLIEGVAACHYDLIGGWLDAGPLNDDATRSWHRPWPRDRLRSWLLPYAVSANLAIWADVLRDLGGWSSAYEAGGEDTELSWRAQLAGYRLGFAPDASSTTGIGPGSGRRRARRMRSASTAREFSAISPSSVTVTTTAITTSPWTRQPRAGGARRVAPSGAPPGWRPGCPTSSTHDVTVDSGSRSPPNISEGSAEPPAIDCSTGSAHDGGVRQYRR